MLAAGEEEARRAQGNFAPIVKVEHSLDASFIPHSGAYCPFDMDVSRRNLTHKQTKIILPFPIHTVTSKFCFMTLLIPSSFKCWIEFLCTQEMPTPSKIRLQTVE